MSGTSLDGVDVVLCEIDPSKCTLLYTITYPLPLLLKQDILKMIQHPTTIKSVGEIEYRLGVLFAEAVLLLIKNANIDPIKIRAIGSHGQTLWHSPQGIHPFSLQLGDSNIISTHTNIAVVSDFRRKDMALGGEGAPFAPAFHAFFFADTSQKLGVVNIGGMANITLLEEKLLGYDTGCGNVLLDTWIQKHHNLPYDKEGKWARSGTLNIVLLALLLADPFFSLPYPKSTGREKFNELWLEEKLSLIKPKKIEAKDIQRTLLELTAQSIANEVLKFQRDEVLLCGGGAKNSFLVERIQALLPKVSVTIAKNADEIEAMTFAWLAYKRIHEEKVNLKDVTGARANAILGCIYL
jgi:anhydro-N-acetylmuramic acid kinase